MWTHGWRDRIWSALDQTWDVIIIGGGITGAGILREATRAGLRTLLVDRCDFASGTSSRSSKLVHGGFRYIKNAQLRLTLESVRERERLLREGRGLINPLCFLLASYQGDRTPAWLFGLGLVLYDLLAFKWGHRYYDAYDLKDLCPPINPDRLKGGYRYFDAQTDDARLVLRVIKEAARAGGAGLNYAEVTGLLRQRSGQVKGIVLRDQTPGQFGRTAEVQARVVINATGPWCDQLRREIGGRSQLRPLRGSHLIFPASRLSLTRSVCIQHPRDRRFVFAFPWEGATLVGTTDVDHFSPLQTDPSISAGEVDYLMEALHQAFPEQDLDLTDVQSSFAGIRPVVDTGKADPSKESRDHVLWDENGLLTVTGGKLTTFRLMAHTALQAVSHRLPGRPEFNPDSRVLDPPPVETDLGEAIQLLKPAQRLRLLGRYGLEAPLLVASASPAELETISPSPTLWAELRWAARSEGVVHLDDLLLRRVRLGLLLPLGGLPEIERIRLIVQPELGWDDSRWQAEVQRYTQLWQNSYTIEAAQNESSIPENMDQPAMRQG